LTSLVCAGDNQNSKVAVPDLSDLSDPDLSEPSGFQRGLAAEEILGATEMDGQIIFMIKW